MYYAASGIYNACCGVRGWTTDQVGWHAKEKTQAQMCYVRQEHFWRLRVLLLRRRSSISFS